MVWISISGQPAWQLHCRCVACQPFTCHKYAFQAAFHMPYILPCKLPIMCTANLPVCSSYLSLQSNPEVQDWMRANSLDSLSQLETYFESRVLDLASLAGRSYIVWQVLPSSVFASDLLIMCKLASITCAIHMCHLHAPFNCVDEVLHLQQHVSS